MHDLKIILNHKYIFTIQMQSNIINANLFNPKYSPWLKVLVTGQNIFLKRKKRITLSRYTRFSTLESIVKFFRPEVNGSRPFNIQVLILQKL